MSESIKIAKAALGGNRGWMLGTNHASLLRSLFISMELVLFTEHGFSCDC